MKYFILISAIITSISAYAGCSSDVLEISRSTGFGFSSSGSHNGSVKHVVKLPLIVNGRSGCLEQEGELSFEVEENKNKLNIIFPKASFKNVENGRTQNYVFIKQELDRTYFEVANFVCVGSEVVSVEAFEGDISEAKVLSELSFQSSMVFSAGAAARSMAQRQEAMRRQFGKRNELPSTMQAYLEENLTEWSKLEEMAVSTPSVFLSTSMRSPLANLDTEFSTLVATKAACSFEFEKVMAPFSLEKLKLPSGVSGKFRRNKLKLSW